MLRLGVNIDHVATVRQARRTYEPDPTWAASLAELGGADGITVHLREDRRHIQDRDVRILAETVTVRLNLEMGCSDEILGIACQMRPGQATLVPESRQEITTEGGLDVILHEAQVQRAISMLHDSGIEVSLFLDPDPRQISTARRIGADAVELHTGAYALARSPTAQRLELEKLMAGGTEVLQQGLVLHAGHGLTYRNVLPVAGIPGMCELNIGHSIISRSIMVGMQQAVREMKDLLNLAIGSKPA